jgi:hypothetical protein
VGRQSPGWIELGKTLGGVVSRLSGVEAELSRNGYVVLAGVLSLVEVAAFRDFLGSALDGHLGGVDVGIRTETDLYDAMWPDFYDFNPAWFGVFCNDRIVGALRQLLGDGFVLTRDSIVHWGYFPGWHTDTTTSEARGELSHLDSDWRMLTVGIYLQAGGGLEVVPGSHLEPDPFVAMRKYRDESGQPEGADRWQPVDTCELPLGAGDAVIFDMRLIHRAAPSMPGDVSGEPCQKIAVFSRASRNIQRHLDAYSDFRFDGAGSSAQNLSLLREQAERWGFVVG